LRNKPVKGSKIFVVKDFFISSEILPQSGESSMEKFTSALVAIAAIFILLAAGITILLAPASGRLPAPEILNLTESANGTTVQVATGDEIRITLEENPSTGYQWIYTVPQAFTVLEDRYTQPDSGILGQKGMHTWTLKAEQKGTWHISWIYKRSWESGATDRPFTVEIVVG
jgi:predicted secreted protein